MGKRYLRSIVSDFQTLTASAEITPVDLPTNPISHLILTIQGTQVAETSAGEYGYLADFVGSVIGSTDGITDLQVQRYGENVMQGQLADLVVLNAILHGYHPVTVKPDIDVGRLRSASFLLSFSRTPYSHDEGLPATPRGQLRFRMTAGTLPASFSARSWALEAVELIEDTPTRHLKYTTLTRALTATGRQRMQLPSANDLLGVLLFDPSTVGVDASDFAFQRVKLLKSNVEQYFQESNWESLLEGLGRRGVIPHALGGHVHGTIPTAADQVTTTALPTAEERFERNQLPNRYNFLDLDPLSDGSWAIEGEPGSLVELDLNSDVSTGTVRVMPVELVKVGGGA